MANPIPTLPADPSGPVTGEYIAELMPMTWPWLLNSGPPELPWLIAASVWMAW
jgi:hypothetical protein